jgi:hypothetical protein
VGPAFIKTNAPFPIWIYLNGDELAKRQLDKMGVADETLDNGFRFARHRRQEHLGRGRGITGMRARRDFITGNRPAGLMTGWGHWSGPRTAQQRRAQCHL